MTEPSCPNESCIQGADNAAKVPGHGSLGVWCGRRRRYRCRGCGSTLSTRTNTACFGLWCSSRVVECVAHLGVVGMSRSAIARVEGIDRHSVDRALTRAVALAERFNDSRHLRGHRGLHHRCAQITTTVPVRKKFAFRQLAMASSTRFVTSIRTGATPASIIPSFSAAAFDRSMIRSST